MTKINKDTIRISSSIKRELKLSFSKVKKQISKLKSQKPPSKKTIEL